MAIAICPVVVFDIVEVETVVFYFLKETGAEEYIAELEARNGNKFLATRLNRQVIVTII